MTGLEEGAHPLAQDIDIIAQAFDHGIADEIPFWGLVKGFDVNVLPGGAADDGTTYIRIEPMGGKSLVEYQLAPKVDTPNPLCIVEEDEDGDISVKPVLARMVVASETLLMPIGTRDGLPLRASQIQVDVLEEGAVISVNDSLKINPIYGEFDGAAYNFIRRKSYEELRLGYIAAFAREFMDS